MITPGGLRLAVADRGAAPDGAPGILCVHGLASNLRIWDAVERHLAPAFRVAAYDQRCHGLSADGDGDYSYRALVADLDAVAAALGLGRPVVVGHSWGASVAVHHAASHPECPGIVLVDGGILDLQGIGMSWEEAQRRLRPRDLEGPPEHVLAKVRDSPPDVPWELAEPVARRSLVVGDGIMRRRTPIPEHMKIVRVMWEEHVWELYARVACPVLVVLARTPDTTDGGGYAAARRAAVDRLRESGVDVRVKWLGTDHDIPLTHPRELASLIGDFVARAYADRG